MEELLQIPRGADGFAGIAHGTPMRRPHRHRELEVNLVVGGRAAYLLGGRRVPLLAGSMIWLFPRQEHLLIDSSSDFSMWVLVFRPALVASCAERGTRRILASPDPGEILCRQILPPRVESLNRLYQGAIDEKGDTEFVNATLRYALVESWRAYQFSGELIPSTQVHPAVARAARIVSDATDSMPLDAVAREAGLSPARLSRLFQQQVGVTLTAFRQQKCLQRFLRLYGTGARHSLIEAALMAGFGSYPQFHRVFCRLMKLSPLAYKRQFRAGPRDPGAILPARKSPFQPPRKAFHSTMMLFRVLLLLSILMTPAFAAPFRIVCLGDSITGPGPDAPGKPAEYDPSGGPSQQRQYLNSYAKYADLLQLVLETHIGEGKVQVINRGWAGNTSAQALARVDSSVVPLKPEIVTVLIGGNDFGGGVNPQVMQQLHTNLTAIVDKCKAGGAKVLLMEYATPRADDMSHVWTHLNAGNPVIAQVAKEEDVPTLELAPLFDEAARTHALSDLASPYDGVHFNPYGEIVTARAIYFKLLDLGWLPSGA